MGLGAVWLLGLPDCSHDLKEDEEDAAEAKSPELSCWAMWDALPKSGTLPLEGTTKGLWELVAVTVTVCGADRPKGDLWVVFVSPP